jgi:hypothetical protein
MNDQISVADDIYPEFWSKWIRRRYGYDVNLITERDTADKVDARFDWRVDRNGRVVAALLADGDTSLAPVQLAIAPGVHGFVSWRDEAWVAHTHHLDAATDRPCRRDVTLVTLPGLVRPDTVEVSSLPRLDRLEPPMQARISFDANAAVDPRRDGWATREANGSWTIAPVAQAVVTLPQARTGKLQLELTGFAYDVVRRPLGFSIRMNGIPLGHAVFNVSAPMRHVFRVPDELAQRGGEVTVEIVADELRSPSADGLGDTRSLGVFVQTIVIREIHAHAAKFSG